MRILGFAGCKRAGKDSAARFILGNVLTQKEVIAGFNINEAGELLVPSAYRDESGQVIEGLGVFDTQSQDPEVQFYMQEMIWPHCKIYNFADPLKTICINLYGIPYEGLYGSNEEREANSPYTWGQLIDMIPKSIRPKVELSKLMTNREFIQTMGDLLRYPNDDCFTLCLIQRILNEQCPFSVISDVRRVSEVEAIKKCGGRVIYLTKELTDGDGHRIEHELDDVDKSLFDDVIDNRSCTIQEKNDLIYKTVRDWGWL